MTIFTIILIAIGLSMDSFSVSLANGLYYVDLLWKRILFIAVTFAAVQALFTAAGWTLGALAANFLKYVDHWIAFILLTYLGLKMILEKNDEPVYDLNVKNVFTQAVATSIDALIVGFSLATLGYGIIRAALVIGLFTFMFSVAGLLIGKRLKRRLDIKSGLIGGIILILLGIKILVEHLGDHAGHLL